MKRDFIFVYTRVQYGLCTLPLMKLCQDTSIKNNLLQLCNDLIARIIVDNLPVENKRDKIYYFNTCVFDWAAHLAKSLSSEEIHQYILTPVRNNWSQVPQLTADLLNGYINYQIAFIEEPTTQALKIWKEICNWVLDSPEIARKTSERHLDLETGEVLQLIIFTQNGKSRIKNDWQHAHLFEDIFDKWVNVAGHNPYAYSHFLTILDGIGWQFAPEITLEWLNKCANTTIYDLWNQRENGIRTAKLLNRIWNNFEKKIRNNKVSLQNYSNLIYQLVKAGIPLAGMLQQKLEGRE